MKRICGKYHVENDQIVKTSTGEVVPDDEPVFLIRGKDRLALPALFEYMRLCERDGCNAYQLSGCAEMIAQFANWRAANADQMKQPGVTKGK